MIVYNPTRSVSVLNKMQERIEELNHHVEEILSNPQSTHWDCMMAISTYITTMERYNAWFFGVCQTRNPEKFEVEENTPFKGE